MCLTSLTQSLATILRQRVKGQNDDPGWVLIPLGYYKKGLIPHNNYGIPSLPQRLVRLQTAEQAHLYHLLRLPARCSGPPVHDQRLHRARAPLTNLTRWMTDLWRRTRCPSPDCSERAPRRRARRPPEEASRARPAPGLSQRAAAARRLRRRECILAAWLVASNTRAPTSVGSIPTKGIAILFSECIA